MSLDGDVTRNTTEVISSQTQLPLVVVGHHQVVDGRVTIVPDALQEVLLALTARRPVHTVRIPDLARLDTVAARALAAAAAAAGGGDVTGVAGTA